MSSGVRNSKSKKGEKLYKYCSRNFNKAECNYPTMEKEILGVIRGIEKLLIFLSIKPFLVRTDCGGILGFVKTEFIKYASTTETPTLAIMA